MAVNIFDKYGIKEVANVYFEALADDKAANIYKGDIVLYLDSLKVSTIEQTAESVDATGGWGNPKLITWNYGKEITITLEDALMSLESLRFMMGGSIKGSSSSNPVWVHRTEDVVIETEGVIPQPVDHLTNTKITSIKAYQDHPVRLINLTKGVRTQIGSDDEYGNGGEEIVGQPIGFINYRMLGTTTAYNSAVGDRVRIFWEEPVVETDSAIEVVISPSTYPGTYRVVGDTFMRSKSTGKDEAFQFVIEQAKVSSEVTLTLQAEGDPSTFSMTLTVLRSDDANEMMKLIRYGGTGDSATNVYDWGSISGDVAAQSGMPSDSGATSGTDTSAGG